MPAACYSVGGSTCAGKPPPFFTGVPGSGLETPFVLLLSDSLPAFASIRCIVGRISYSIYPGRVVQSLAPRS